jgi:hypothetical protein
MLGTNTGIVRPVVPGYIYMPHALEGPMGESIGRGATLAETVRGPTARAPLKPDTAGSSASVAAPAADHSKRANGQFEYSKWAYCRGAFSHHSIGNQEGPPDTG